MSNITGKNGSNQPKDKSWVDEILGDMDKSSAAKQIAVGSVAGWATGYLTLKVGKMVAVAVGGGILVLQIANHKGYIKIDWDRVQRQADKVVDKIEKETTGRGPTAMDKLERFVDRKLDKAENLINKKQRKARGWFESFINNGDDGYKLQELHIFVLSFATGVALGLASA